MTQLLDLLLGYGDASRHICEMVGFIGAKKLAHVSKTSFLDDDLTWFTSCMYDSENVDWGLFNVGVHTSFWVFREDLFEAEKEKHETANAEGVVFLAGNWNFCELCNVHHSALQRSPTFSRKKVWIIPCGHLHELGNTI